MNIYIYFPFHLWPLVLLPLHPIHALLIYYMYLHKQSSACLTYRDIIFHKQERYYTSKASHADLIELMHNRQAQGLTFRELRVVWKRDLVLNQKRRHIKSLSSDNVFECIRNLEEGTASHLSMDDGLCESMLALNTNIFS